MVRGILFKAMLLLVLVSGLNEVVNAQSIRDPYVWPYDQSSIWNMPIGDNARYVPQPIDHTHVDGIQADMDIIIMKPNAADMEIYGTRFRWSSESNPTTRCEKFSDRVLERFPIPADYKTIFYKQDRPNNPVIILKRDGRTLYQTQPFQACAGGYATSGLTKPYTGHVLITKPDMDLFGDGRVGMHGGSGLNTMGGAIRLGELLPGAPPMRHSLKISFPGEHYLYYDASTQNGYRWPAVQHDINAPDNYLGNNEEAKIGCLRAIPASVDLESLNLETIPGKKLAWTLQHFGAYQVEEVPWARTMIAVEEGPDGSVVEEFKEVYGYDFVTKDKTNNPWFRDIMKIMPHMHIVANNFQESVGGGGTPLVELAPEFGKTGNLAPSIELIVAEENFTMGDSIVLKANASDMDGTIKSVSFYADNQLIGTDSTEPYEIKYLVENNSPISFFASTMDDQERYTGSFPFRFNPTKANGISVSWKNNTADTVDMGSPLTIEAEVSSTVAIRRVDFYHGFRLIGSDNTAPYQHIIPNVSDGVYHLSAKAVAVDGTSNLSTVRSLVGKNISNDAPQVSVTSDKEVIAPGGIVILSGSALDRDGFIDSLEIYQNGERIYVTTTASTNYVVKDLESGSYNFILRAYDNSGTVGESRELSVTVSEAVVNEVSNMSQDIILFPNPTKKNSKVKIEGLNASHYGGTVIVSDLAGKEVVSQKLSSGSMAFSLPNSGVYTIKMVLNNQLIIKKLLVD